jgi:CubicO group peptidase (beta-lactamase class C family)
MTVYPTGMVRFMVVLLLAAVPLLAQKSEPAGPVRVARDLPTATPEAEGFSSARLDVLRKWLQTEPTTAMMVISHGKVIFSYGDVSHVSKIASVRKSILAMLMGKYVMSGQIDISRNVKDLGLDDTIPFSVVEEKATLGQLIHARFGKDGE